MKLVWLIPSDKLFEYDWIHELFLNLVDDECDYDHSRHTIYRDAIFVFNHSIDYESWFLEYQELGIPFIAIHLSDETLGDSVKFYDYTSCKFVVRTYHHPIHSNHSKVLTIGLGYKTGFHEYCCDNLERYYHWCFAGNLHDERRLHAIQAFSSLIPYQLHLTKEGFNSVNNLSLDKYAEWLSTSKFALCPTGQGNLDSFRVYEACEASTIPIVLKSTIYQNYDYWRELFTNWEGSIPFIIVNNWEEGLLQAGDIIMNRKKYETLQKELVFFWTSIKRDWRARISSHLLENIQ